MRTFNKPAAAKVVAAAALLFVTPALAACGSDDSDSAGSGDTIKVMTYGPFDAKGFSLPQVKTGAQAGVDKVNEAGGINGKLLELIACNDNNDPNTAAGCARQAVQEKVVAVLGGFSTFEPQLIPVLEKAGIPVIGGTPISNFTSKVLYPITGGAASSLFGLGAAMAANPVCGGKVGGVIEDFAATQGAIKLFELGVKASGAEFTGVSKAPQGARDFAPAVTAASEKAVCVGFLAGPQTSPQIVAAAAKVPAIKVLGGSESVLPNASIKALGAAADGVLAVSNYQPLTADTDTAAMKDFLARGEKIDADFDPDQGAASAYLASAILARALEGSTGDVTKESIIAALDKLSGFETGLGPVVDYTKKNPTQAFSRLPVATPMYQWVAKDGQYTLASDTTIDISTIYAAAAAAGQ